MPDEDRHKIFDWTNRMIGSEDPEYTCRARRSSRPRSRCSCTRSSWPTSGARQPRDDIVTTLLNAEVDGDPLSDMDFNLFFLLLSVAGNETTRNAISHGMNAFLENPDQYAAARRRPRRARSTGATEEILRWASPVMYFRRNVTKDTELRGQEIKAGDKVSIWYISANRDEDVFDDPFTFDIRRDPNPHIAFGGGGPHFCLGATWPAWRSGVLFEELAKRVPRSSSSAPPDRLRSNFIGGIKHLPVRSTSKWQVSRPVAFDVTGPRAGRRLPGHRSYRPSSASAYALKTMAPRMRSVPHRLFETPERLLNVLIVDDDNDIRETHAPHRRDRRSSRLFCVSRASPGGR